jgi:hypothetical protein
MPRHIAFSVDTDAAAAIFTPTLTPPPPLFYACLRVYFRRRCHATERRAFCYCWLLSPMRLPLTADTPRHAVIIYY